MSVDKQEERSEQSIRFVAKRYRPGALDPDRAWLRFSEAQGISSLKRVWMRPTYAWTVAASVALLVSLIGFYQWQQKQPDWVTFTAEAQQVKQLTLPDQTEISLAGGSRLTYDARHYGQEVRLVRLEGKALFEVRHDEACPFRVETAESRVTVLGTRFQVVAEKERTLVDVMSGKVGFALREKKDSVALTAGLQAYYTSGDQRIKVTEQPNPNELAWLTHRLRFEETPLPQVVADLEQSYQTMLSYSGDANKRLTVTLEELTLEEALQVVNETLDVRITQNPPNP